MKAPDHQFGPWTTSLHHGTRLELSSFWRRRLVRLGARARTPADLPRRTLAFLLLVATAILLIPRVDFQTATAAEESPKPPAAATATASDEPPFTATFSNGVKIHLIGLSENPSKGKPWWKPDGSPLGGRPYEQVHATMAGASGSIGAKSAGAGSTNRTIPTSQPTG